MDALNTYAHYFSTLNRASLNGEKAPQKIIMLLAVIGLVGQGYISGPAIVLDDRLKQQFNLLWSRYVGELSIFTPAFIDKPHMETLTTMNKKPRTLLRR